MGEDGAVEDAAVGAGSCTSDLWSFAGSMGEGGAVDGAAVGV